MSKHSGSAVDEGRNPYGSPGRGNGQEVWQRLNDVPCPTCGATTKHLVIVRNDATIVCGAAQRPAASDE